MLIFDTEAPKQSLTKRAQMFIIYSTSDKIHQTVKVKLTAFTTPLSRGKNSKVNTVDWPAEMTELIADEVRITWESSQLYWLL